MMKILSVTFFIMSLCLGAVWAGPEGNYDVVGTNPGGGSYEGVVSVKRNGDTYSVLWNVGGTEYVGTGLGAANVKGTSVMGPASEDDTAIAISYVSGGGFGLTFYVLQRDGTWSGIWTFGGSKQIGSETWTPQ